MVDPVNVDLCKILECKPEELTREVLTLKQRVHRLESVLTQRDVKLTDAGLGTSDMPSMEGINDAVTTALKELKKVGATAGMLSSRLHDLIEDRT